MEIMHEKKKKLNQNAILQCSEITDQITNAKNAEKDPLR